MKKIFIIFCFILSHFISFSQASVSIMNLNLSTSSQYDQLVSGTDTFFVVPIVLDSFITDVISFQFNIVYDPSLVQPLLNSNSFDKTSPIIAPLQCPTCNGPVGFAETNSTKYFFLLLVSFDPKLFFFSLLESLANCQIPQKTTRIRDDEQIQLCAYFLFCLLLEDLNPRILIGSPIPEVPLMDLDLHCCS